MERIKIKIMDGTIWINAMGEWEKEDVANIETYLNVALETLRKDLILNNEFQLRAITEINRRYEIKRNEQ